MLSTNNINNTLSYFTVKDIGEECELYIISIDDIVDDLRKSIDRYLIKICEGNSDSELRAVKNRIITFLDSKRGTDLEIDAVAEFMIHHLLNVLGYEPKFLFFNLEEGSLKKGFDGFYLFNGEQWIVESKSGRISTKDISHDGKIKESYKDLKNKLLGKGTNNPWQNALNHASLYQVGVIPDLLKTIKSFSDQYQTKNFQQIKDHNVIPGSTIFLDGNWKTDDSDELEVKIKEIIKTFDYKKIKVLCTTKRSVDLFWDYLSSN